MAEEHIWEKNLDADDGYLVVPDDNSNKIIKVRDDETNKVVKISDFTLNSRVDTHDVDDFVYAIIDEHKIIRCDRNFENKVEIYSTTDNLYMLEADRETLYFTKNDVLCRLHLASGIVDELVALPRKIGSIMPHSNYEVEYSIQTQDYTDYLANGDFSVLYPEHIDKYDGYMYDSRTKTNTEYVSPIDYTTGGREISADNLENNTPIILSVTEIEFGGTTINGKYIPLTIYPSGDYYKNRVYVNKVDCTNRKVPCVSHKGQILDTCGRYKGSFQCAGFAHEVFDYIFDISTDTIPVYDQEASKYTSSEIINKLKSIPIGSVLRCETSGRPHSMILIAYNSVSEKVTTYEANVDHTCRIAFKEYTIDDFTTLYGQDFHVRTLSHTHSYITAVAEGCKKCTICGAVVAHGPTTISYTNSAHTEKCNTCGYTAPSQAHALTYYISGETHYQKCSVCSYVSGNITHSGAWQTNGTNHWKTCVCGFTVTASTAHTYGGWASTGGSSHSRRCTACGYTQTGSHNMSPPTGWYQNTSTHYKNCSTCGYSQSGGHGYGGWTSTGSSSHVRSCTTCSYAQSAGHSIQPMDQCRHKPNL